MLIRCNTQVLHTPLKPPRFYGKTYPSRTIFDGLKVGKSQSYEAHLNQYNIIKLSLNELSGRGNAYQDYIKRFVLKYNIAEVRDEVIKMVNHMPVRIEIKKEYAAG